MGAWFITFNMLLLCNGIAVAQCLVNGYASENPFPSAQAYAIDYSDQSKKLYVIGGFEEDVFGFGGFQLQGVSEMPISDLYLMQLHSSGSVNWLIPMGKTNSGPNSGRVKAIDNGVLAGVRFIDTVDVGGIQISVGYENALLVRLDLAGNVNWVKHFESDQVCTISSIEVDELGNIYVLGHFVNDIALDGNIIQASSNVDGEIFIAKLDSEGDVIWMNHFAGGIGNDQAEAISYSDGHLYLCGFFAGQLEIGQTTLTATTSNNGFVCKVDTSGNVQWVKQLKSDVVRELRITHSTSSIFLSGVFQDQLMIDQEMLNSNGFRDGFVLAMDFSGDIRWMKTLGGEQADAVNRIENISDKLLLISGEARSDFSVDGFSFVNLSSVGQQNGFVLLMDTSGVVQCLTSVASADDSQVFAEHVSNDTIFLVGNYQTDVSVGDTTFNSLNNGVSIFTAQTCMGCSELIRLDVNEVIVPKPVLRLYPNPATHTVRLTVSSSTFNARSLAVTDILGNTIMNLRPETSDLELDISGLAVGVYTVAATLQNGEMLRQRLVVQ